MLWRVVVLTDDGYLEGFDSLLIDEGPMRFKVYPSDTAALEAATSIWAVDRLRWFSRDFLKVSVEDDLLVLADLRMGQEPNYVFTHVVAEGGDPDWRERPDELLAFEFEDRALRATWERIWSAP